MPFHEFEPISFPKQNISSLRYIQKGCVNGALLRIKSTHIADRPWGQWFKLICILALVGRLPGLVSSDKLRSKESFLFLNKTFYQFGDVQGNL